MHRLSFSMAFLGMLVFLTGGCTSGGDGNQSGSTPTPTTSPVASAPLAPKQTFPTQVVAGKQPETLAKIPVTAVSGLIQSTNPDERVKELQKGRPDPFALVPVQPIVKFSPSPTPTASATTSPTPIASSTPLPSPSVTPSAARPTPSPQATQSPNPAPTSKAQPKPSPAPTSKTQPKPNPAPSPQTQPKQPILRGLGTLPGEARPDSPISPPEVRSVASIGSLLGTTTASINNQPDTALSRIEQMGGTLVASIGPVFVDPSPATANLPPTDSIAVNPTSPTKPNSKPHPNPPPKVSCAQHPSSTAPNRGTANSRPQAQANHTPHASSPPRGNCAQNPNSSPKPSTAAHPSASKKPSTAARPSASKKPSTAARPSASPKPSTAARPSASPKPSTAARPSASPKPSTAARPSNRSGANAAGNIGAAVGTPRVGNPSSPLTTAAPSTPPTLPVIPTPTFIPQLPGLPEPELAKNTEITGVVQVGDVTQAIVKLPNETVSRYVKVGARFGDGMVLVKRIEMNPADTPGTPVVVLEQYGIEVRRPVGETKPRTPTVGMP